MAAVADHAPPVPPALIGGEYEELEELSDPSKTFINRVVLARGKDGRNYVLKQQQQQLGRVAFMHQALVHPNIVRHFGVVEDEEVLLRGGRRHVKKVRYTVMEHVTGENLGHTIARGPLSVEDARRMLLPIARGMAYLHGIAVQHYDLRPEKILLDKGGDETLKILGIGGVGTEHYMSPERLQRPAPMYAFGDDMWALGLIYAEMLQGRRVWEMSMFGNSQLPGDCRPSEIQRLVKRCEGDDLLRRMLLRDRGERITPGEIVAVLEGRPGTDSDHDSESESGSPPRRMEIVVKTTHGKQHSLRVTSSHTVHQLKVKMQVAWGVPVSEQRLLFRGRDLGDGFTVEESNITNKAKLHLVVRLRGGKPVIVFRPGDEEWDDVDVHVTLDPNLWSISHVFPRPDALLGKMQEMAWTGLRVSPHTGTVTPKTGLPVPSLFWESEARSDRVEEIFVPDMDGKGGSVIVGKNRAARVLYENLLRVGLTLGEAMEMTTHWQPQMEQLTSPNVEMCFLSPSILESVARLNVTKKGSVCVPTFRYFLLFRGIDSPAMEETCPVMKDPYGGGFCGRRGCVFEWGGMNLDEHEGCAESG